MIRSDNPFWHRRHATIYANFFARWGVYRDGHL